MHSLLLATTEEQKDVLIAELWEAGTLGIREQPGPGGAVQLEAFFDEPLPALAERFSTSQPEWRRHEDIDWVVESRGAWHPIPIGERLLLIPDWHSEPLPPGRIPIVIHPGLGYGTGLHETTQLTLQAMEAEVRSGDRILDLGCGTGILTQAAGKLGAASLFACDIDPEAVLAARRNFDADATPAALFIGSLRSVKPGSVDLVIANINALAITNLARYLAAVARRVIVSGFPTADETQVVKALAPAGLAVGQRFEMNGWLALILRASQASVSR